MKVFELSEAIAVEIVGLSRNVACSEIGRQSVWHGSGYARMKKQKFSRTCELVSQVFGLCQPNSSIFMLGLAMLYILVARLWAILLLQWTRWRPHLALGMLRRASLFAEESGCYIDVLRFFRRYRCVRGRDLSVV